MFFSMVESNRKDKTKKMLIYSVTCPIVSYKNVLSFTEQALSNQVLLGLVSKMF